MDHEKITYYNEISLMMFGFGDSHKPNPETVRLVETIVLSQLKRIVQEALKYSEGTNLKGEELVFLMRKNKWKMRRFVKYLQNSIIKNKLDKLDKLITFEEEQSKKSKNNLLEFIEKLDETGELTDLSEFDEIKYERQLRADRISEALDEKKYMEFYKARCASFNSRGFSHARNSEKLRLWIDPKKEITFSYNALDVLAYYAYETVAQITDYALLVRMDMRATGDPLKPLSGAHYTAAMFNGEHRFTGANPDYSRVYTGQPPISVNEIKEVMRRVNSPQAGRLYFGRKLPESQFFFAI
ncbi:transcription initiation protein SPT3 homolog [Agrilus planipennis]|uniref:Transcription initiation protein SPT3 homolog n=1 Tax=Agrilus planipennis TaxID=224129 RepID=A0A1W4WUS4_AGRPL|nr:transcription initiation protein SPT3 homolog [Agrilus planipennis]